MDFGFQWAFSKAAWIINIVTPQQRKQGFDFSIVTKQNINKPNAAFLSVAF